MGLMKANYRGLTLGLGRSRRSWLSPTLKVHVFRVCVVLLLLFFSLSLSFFFFSERGRERTERELELENFNTQG